MKALKLPKHLAPKPPTEHEIQAALFSWINAKTPAIPELENAYAVPNGSYKSKASAGRFRAEGLRAGVPDICLAVMAPRPQGVSYTPDGPGHLPPSFEYGSLYIEMKRPGEKPRPSQVVWADRLEARGMKVIRRCTCWREAARHMLEYLGHEVTRRKYPELFLD